MFLSYTNYSSLLSEKPDPSAVIEVRGTLSLRGLLAGDLSKYFPDRIFHQTELEAMDSNSENIKLICNPNITRFDYVARTSENGIFTTYLEKMPKLKFLTYRVRTSIPDLVSGLRKWKQTGKLGYLEIICEQWSIVHLINSPEVLFDFIKLIF